MWVALALMPLLLSAADYQVKVSQLNHDIKDLSQRTSKTLDQNGERCALLKFETAVPALISFNLGAQQIEKRENKDDEVWIWISADVKKMTVQCTGCAPLRDYRVSLKAGDVYTAKITTGLPQETSTKQNLNLYCEQVPYLISIDGAAPDTGFQRNYFAELSIGTHEIFISAPYYKPYRQTIRLLRSNAYNDTIRLENNYGELIVNSLLTDLQVRVDEVLRTERIIKVEPGVHTISISKDRYETFNSKIDVKLGEKRNLQVSLVPAFAAFTITAATDMTEIWVDDELVGHDKAVVELLFGEHTIQGRRQGYDTYEFPTHEFTAESSRKISIPKLNQQFGAVRISIFPPEATVYLDGKEITTLDGVYTAQQMNVGTHYVFARMTDYTSVRDSITVSSGAITSKEYHLEHIALGVISLETDDDVAIYRQRDTGEQDFLGLRTFNGKLPVGENIIVLKNQADVSCRYRCFVNEGTVNKAQSMPFIRKLMVRTNVLRCQICLRADENHLIVSPNKKVKVEPLKYEISVQRQGYQDYRDSIDMSKQGVKELVYHATMRTYADTASVNDPLKPRHLRHDFYDNAGRWYLGIVGFGYNYSIAENAHYVSASLLDFRYKMFGMSLLEAEMNMSKVKDDVDSLVTTIAWKPTLSLYIPASRGFAFSIYGGAKMNIHDMFIEKVDKPRYGLVGGMSMLFQYVGWWPMQIFAEYHYPLDKSSQNAIKKYEQQFRVGMKFSWGVDR